MPSELFFTQDKIRELYLDYFVQQQHLKLESFSLIPESTDKSLLLINAGMAPLKKYFSGQKVPPSKRVTTCQKCVRTNDIENVGKTARHATFFEMLGNFSFGDYFKDDAINWAWDFVTQVLKLPEEKLFATVYEDDDEAFEIWERKLKSARKIFKMGKKDNFWEIGEGPCGPCSEIYFDRGERFGCERENCQPGCDCDRFIEIWNLVFTQFNRNSDGSYSKLKQKNIDTGMGLERISVVMQNVNSIFEIDTMRKIISKIADASKTNYGNNNKKDISIRIIADHIKAAVFMISDDIFVSNEGRGYILRRLIRRAICRMKILGIESNSFLRELAELVINIFGGYYRNLVGKKDEIIQMLLEEEKKFNDTLLTGLNMFMDLIDKAKRTEKKIISGQEAFKLHDTFGCNMELMQEIADENEIIIDKKEFAKELEKQKQRARESQINQTSNSFDLVIQEEIKKLDATEFLGYENFKLDEANILMLINSEKVRDEISEENDFWVIFDKTIFFAEESGQISDSGILKTDTGTANIISCKKILGDKYVHRAKLISGVIKKNQKATLQLDIEKRERIARNHTATHLLHKILREKIFADTKQMGSYIDNNYFRFDFLCKRALSKGDLNLIENELNRKIFDSLEVKITNKNIDDAIGSGVTALFDEKYGDIVRVVSIGGYSMELCSGTHVKNTSQINCFKIIGESGVSAGIRRIEAVTGPMAIEFYNKTQSEIDKACEILKSDKNNFLHRLESAISEDKKNKNKIIKLENILANQMAKKICENCEVVNNIKLAFDSFDDDFDLKFLREIGDKIKNDLKSCVIVLVNKKNDQVNFIFERTEDLNLNAGEIIKNIAKKFGVNGGGRKNYAQLGGLKADNLNSILKEVKEILSKC